MKNVDLGVLAQKRLALRRGSPCGTVGRLTRGLNRAFIQRAGDTTDAGAGRANLRPTGIHRVGESPTCGCPGTDCTPNALQYTSAFQGVTDQANNPPTPLNQFVRAIGVDFTCFCSSSPLAFNFTAGEINFAEIGGIHIFIGGTATGIDGTEVYATGPDATAGMWVPILPPRDGVFTQNFASPGGPSYVKVIGTPGGGAFAGLRNWAFTITVAP